MATTNKNSAITEKLVWFITGCSTGFGRELGERGLDGYLETKTVTVSLDPLAG